MEPPEGKNISFLIKEKAAGLGFDLCGFAPSGILSEHESRLKTWCSEGMNGDMAYLARNIENGKVRNLNPAIATAAIGLTVIAHPELSKLVKGSRFSQLGGREAIDEFSEFWLNVLVPSTN